MNYRILYFFYGQHIVVLDHALTKEGKIPGQTSSARSGESAPLSVILPGTPTKKRYPMTRVKDALEIIDHMTGNDKELQRLIDEETVNAQVAGLIYQARTKARLTQQELAELVGTKQSVIARLEDAHYEGHSLTMLQRIAAAVDRRVDIRFLPAKHVRRRAA